MRSRLAIAAACVSAVKSATWNLKTTYQGDSFFGDMWHWNSSAYDNTTWGNVQYVDQAYATANDLAYINDAGQAIIKVDNTTSGVGNSTFGRPSIKIVSNELISQNSLVLFDAVHVPYGCSVWPAFWTIGSPLQIDDEGEIDIFEAFNLSPNYATLHTKAGCTQSNSSSMPFSGSIVESTNCDHTVNYNQGCSLRSTKEGSSGAAFAQAGGGVWAMQWVDNGISQWFWSRADVPADVGTDSPNPDNWGVPVATWPATTCNPATFFQPQHLVFTITLCGAAAGEPSIFNQTCSGVCTDLIGDPSNYNTAYFQVNFIKTFTTDNSVKNTTTSATTSAPTQSQTQGSGADIVKMAGSLLAGVALLAVTSM